VNKIIQGDWPWHACATPTTAELWHNNRDSAAGIYTAMATSRCSASPKPRSGPANFHADQPDQRLAVKRDLVSA
jgi:hypothetical protein